MCYSHAKNSIYMHCKGACSLCFRRLYNILCLRKVFYQVFLPLMIMISYFAVKDFIYFLSSIINFHRINWKFFFSLSCTVRKVSKYRVISDPYFPVFGVNVGKYRPEITPYLDTFHTVMVQHFLEWLATEMQSNLFQESHLFGKHSEKFDDSVWVQTVSRILVWWYIQLEVFCSNCDDTVKDTPEFPWLLTNYTKF